MSSLGHVWERLVSIEARHEQEIKRWPPEIIRLPADSSGWRLDEKLRIKGMPAGEDLDYDLPLTDWEDEIVTGVSVDDGMDFIHVTNPADVQSVQVQNALRRGNCAIRSRKIYFSDSAPTEFGRDFQVRF